MGRGQGPLQKQGVWRVLRAGVANGAVDTALGVTTSKWSSVWATHGKDGTGALKKLSPEASHVELRSRHLADDQTAVLDIYLFRGGPDAQRSGDAAFYVGQVTVKAGQLQADSDFNIGANTGLISQKIVIDAEYWLSALNSSEAANEEDKQATLSFAKHGYKWLLVLATTVAAGTVAVDYAEYNDF